MSFSNSPGFLYYDTSGTNDDNSGVNESSGSDFIEFDNNLKTPQKNFSPGYCSSPTNYNRGSRRGRNNKFHGISGRGRYNRNDSFGDNRKFGNNSFGESRGSPGYRNHSDRRSHNKSDIDNDISNYINPAMVQDPWKQLEEELMQKIQIKKLEKT